MTMTPAKLKDIESRTNQAWIDIMEEVRVSKMLPEKQERIERKIKKYAVHYHHLADALFETLS